MILIVTVVFILFVTYHPGKYLPHSFTRFKFDPRKIESLRSKRSNSTSSEAYIISSEPKDPVMRTKDTELKASQV
jgi:hypothetical protein